MEANTTTPVETPHSPEVAQQTAPVHIAHTQQHILRVPMTSLGIGSGMPLPEKKSIVPILTSLVTGSLLSMAYLIFMPFIAIVMVGWAAGNKLLYGAKSKRSGER
ncbi:MAG TPA: hypothetical protein VKX17_02625 [Planctomycetota bacterium]|nr:hypothetical protein [Planctomycetota bacterium]